MTFARQLWTRIEAVHAVTYFSPESREAAKAAGLKGFWMGYFGCRAAPLGAVTAATVEALFYNFAPTQVRRSLPDAWAFARPEDLLAVRADAAAAAIRRIAPGAEDAAARTADALSAAVLRADPGGRPLFAANRELPLPDDPVARLWQLCTTLREHRGDGHVAILVANGVDGLAAHVLIAAENGTPPEMLQQARGWTPEDWDAAARRLTAEGLLDEDGALRPAGRELRRRIESRTDALAARAYEGLDDDARQRLLDALEPVAVPVGAMIPAPNPIGLRTE